MTPASAPAPRPAMTPGERLTGAWATLVLIGLPLCALQQVDALLMFATPLDLLRDLALLAWLCGLPALLLVLAAMPAPWLVGRGPRAAWRAEVLANTLVFAPVAWVLIWQSARMSWLWLKQATGHQFIITPPLRYGAMLAFVLLMVAAWRVARSIGLWAGLRERLAGMRKPLFVLLVACAALLLISPPPWAKDAAAPSGPAPTGRPDLILITLDALAAQDAQVCNPDSTLMPRLSAFAAHASCFTRFYASSNFTTPTTSTIETGTLPWTHLATQISAKIAPGLQQHTLADALHAQGYRTYTSTDNQLASVRHHGSYSGWMHHAITPSALWRDRLRAALTVWPQTSLPLLVDSALSFLGAFDTQLHGTQNPFESARLLDQVDGFLAQDDGSRPAFVWVHSMPPHSPYLPPPSTKYRKLGPGQLERWSDFLDENIPYAPAQQQLVDWHRARYQESIMATDAAVGTLLERLERQGRLRNAIVVISADHGESFEQGFLGHAGPHLHEAVIKVPLIVKLPGQATPRVIEQPVSQADLVPSLLDQLGMQPLAGVDGRSIAPLWRGEHLSGSPVLAMSMERQSRFSPLRQGHFALVDGDFKLLLHLPQGQLQLFDLGQDPGELQDVSALHPDRVRAMRARIETGLADAERRRPAALTR